MKKLDLIKFLNEYLKIGQYEDTSKNGLQVDTTKNDIKKIWYAVDASTYIFDKAVKENVDMVICHHGLFWWFDPIVTWVHYQKLSKLIKNDISLYACHLPLDGHEEVGNNIVMLNKFVEIMNISNFDIEQNWHAFWLKFIDWVFLKDVIEIYCKSIWIVPEIYNFWNKEKINSVYFSSGGGLYSAKATKEKKYDLLITGEWAHYEIISAKEMGQSVLLWWHYETEVFGVQTLAEKLKKDFGIEVVFLDEKY